MNTEEAKQVFVLIKKGWTYKAIGEKFGVSRESIRLILKGEMHKSARPKGFVFSPMPHRQREEKERNKLLNKEHNRLTPRKIVGRTDDNGETLIEADCKCGGKTVVRMSQFKSGKVKSCGCLAKETVRKLGLGLRRSSEEQIRTAFTMRMNGATHKEIAKFLGCSEPNVSYLMSGQLYQELMPEGFVYVKGQRAKAIIQRKNKEELSK